MSLFKLQLMVMGLEFLHQEGAEGETSRCYLAAHHQILAHAAAVDVYRRKFKVFSWFLSEFGGRVSFMG
jgi:beta-glucosidase/6-phospho-beta-glucosidase/beta-galactosidase